MVEQSDFLSDLTGRQVLLNEKKIGKLADLAAVENGAIPVVTHIVVGRPFGDPSLFVPWENVASFSKEKIVINIESPEKYLEEPGGNAILLKDYVMDKKVLDVANRDVDVVYDIRLIMKNGKLYVSAVDFSRERFLKRIGLGFLVGMIPEETKHTTVSWNYIQPLENVTSLSGDIRLKVLKEKLSELPPEDLADVLEVVDRDQRVRIFHSLDDDTAAEALEETEPRVQREILASTSTERVAQIFAHLSAVQIAEIISILPREDAEEFEKLLKGGVASRVHEIITQHDVPASTLASRRFLAFPGDLTVEDAFTRFRTEAPNCMVTMYIYVVDDKRRLRGVIDINELLQANPKSRLEEIMTKNVVTLAPGTMRAEVEELFRKYGFRAIPVVDESRKVVGVIREKDVFRS